MSTSGQKGRAGDGSGQNPPSNPASHAGHRKHQSDDRPNPKRDKAALMSRTCEDPIAPTAAPNRYRAGKRNARKIQPGLVLEGSPAFPRSDAVLEGTCTP